MARFNEDLLMSKDGTDKRMKEFWEINLKQYIKQGFSCCCSSLSLKVHINGFLELQAALLLQLLDDCLFGTCGEHAIDYLVLIFQLRDIVNFQDNFVCECTHIS